MKRPTICLCLAILLLGSSPASAQVQGRVRRVGLFEGGAPLVRPGKWCFVEVELRNQDLKPLAGELHVEQLDRDGDVVTSVEEVALAPEGPWRPYEVYFVPNQSENIDTIRVTLFDDQGRLIRMLTDTGEEVDALTSPTFSELSAEELLILDLTTPSKLPHVAVLDTQKKRNEGDYTNLRRVRGLSPTELPRRWQGLEPVDAIVWDDANPSELSQQQVDALTDWVRHGGRLLITAGRNWQMLAGSGLASALPVTITGANNRTEALEFLDILKNDIYEGRLARHYSRHPILRCRMIRTSKAIGIPSQCANQQIAFRNLLGRGSLTFVGASLRQLLPPPKPAPPPSEESADKAPAVDADRQEFQTICTRVIGWTFLGLPKVLEEPTSYLNVEPVNLFDLVRQTIGFQTLSAAFLIFAVIFAIGYVMTATAGSYWYLKRRAWQHHCWSAFAIVSLAGIVIGTGMVWTLRGMSTKLWETSVIDAKAGEDYGYATCLFGVKTPDHTKLDLTLPVGGVAATGIQRFGPLRVMPRSTSFDVVESKYVAPDVFRSVHAGELLKGVPVRATLKEFEGTWNGPLGGTLEAKFVIHEGEEGRFGEGSYIVNHLGVILNGCRILTDVAEIAGGGQTVTTSCLTLGSLPASGPGSELDGDALQERLYFRTTGSGANAVTTAIPNLDLRLARAIRQWQGEVRSFGMLAVGGSGKSQRPLLSTNQEYASLLLLSVFDLLDTPPNGQKAPLRSHGRSLDCTHQITRETAILIGYTEQASPAVLMANGRNLIPEKSRTMYRFVIPVERR